MIDDRQVTELINRVRSGDRTAVEELVARYGPEVKAAVRHALASGNRLGRLVRPSDVFQSVMLLLLGAAGEPSRVESGRAYLATMLHNRISHHGRRRNSLKRGGDRAVGEAELAGFADPGPSPSHAAAVREEWEALLRALPPSEQVVAEGRLAGKTFAEIAREIGQNRDAVQKRFRRAVDLARNALWGATDQ